MLCSIRWDGVYRCPLKYRYLVVLASNIETTRFAGPIVRFETFHRHNLALLWPESFSRFSRFNRFTNVFYLKMLFSTSTPNKESIIELHLNNTKPLNNIGQNLTFFQLLFVTFRLAFYRWGFLSVNN